MKKNVFLLVMALFLFAMCKTEESREQKLLKISNMESDYLSTDYNLALEKSQQLMDRYVEYAKQYPQDSLAPELLMRCGMVALNSFQPTYAVTLFKRIYDEYPQSPLRSEALFRMAFSYDNMDEPELAKPLYEQFLIEFPDDPLVQDVEVLLENVGKTPEELIQYLIEQQSSEEEELPI